ncbi:TetR/AcrR family transcriptional regulator [Brucella sp. NM4]|uniref:TetR/AcrR family transcriptional regulator n=1 Tax=Brucella/Ochrobactrum group TaxID=2826938 RepID=UPI0024BC992D|nr:TetR/AcrR family transcriptional regulator [Brucella sp. NM4]WHS33281.1 TetR/AcrR family transcriptional regulator [Brucella sp. NM4]WHT43383.1 TetR/AcrR family transcriptional regulator [Ochrobactrum sp. SSR]
MKSVQTPFPASTESAREKLLNAAAVLFYDQGIGGTGIDAIVEKAGVAKKSLYNNFASKADLVNQYLEVRHAEWLGLYDARLQKAVTPLEKVLAVFDAYQDHAEFAYEHGFRGCGLLNAAAELMVGDIGRQAVKHHKREVEALLAGHLAELLPDAPERAAALARQLSFLLEGAMSRAGLEGNSACIQEAGAMASDMLGAL